MSMKEKAAVLETSEICSIATSGNAGSLTDAVFWNSVMMVIAGVILNVRESKSCCPWLVRENKINCIIVKDFSRFGRNLLEVGDYLDQIFPFLGVRFIAVNEGYDSGKGKGSSVSLDVSLKALVYEMYSRDVSEKVRSLPESGRRQGIRKK